MSTKWRELNEGEKPGRGMEIRIPGDKQPLGVVIKVGPSGITYRPHGGGALQLISTSAEVEVRATGDEEEEKEKEKVKTKKSGAKTKKSKAASAEPEQLEIVESEQTEEDKNESQENDEDTEKAEEEETTSTKPVSVSSWMRIEDLVEKSGVPLGRILKARRQGAFEGMTKPDPDYDGVGRKPLIYSPAALKVAKELGGGSGKGGRPPGTGKHKSGNPAARRVSESSAEKPARSTVPPKRHVNRPATTPAQSHLYAAGESLLDGIDAEITRLTELKEKLSELWGSFAS